MTKVRFNECLNKETRFFNISIGVILGSCTTGITVWALKNLLFGVAASVVGTHMVIKDHISKDTAKVDHIPLAFAVPVGILEEFGYIITRGFEQAFRPFLIILIMVCFLGRD